MSLYSGAKLEIVASMGSDLQKIVASFLNEQSLLCGRYVHTRLIVGDSDETWYAPDWSDWSTVNLVIVKNHGQQTCSMNWDNSDDPTDSYTLYNLIPPGCISMIHSIYPAEQLWQGDAGTIIVNTTPSSGLKTEVEIFALGS